VFVGVFIPDFAAIGAVFINQDVEVARANDGADDTQHEQDQDSLSHRCISQTDVITLNPAIAVSIDLHCWQIPAPTHLGRRGLVCFLKDEFDRVADGAS
jgi:hypothetical protein